MIPKIIHRTSNTKTWEEMHVIRRAKKIMPDFDHRFWTDEDNLALVNRIFPQYRDEFMAISRGVVRADIARCLFLYEHGGIYCDTDYLFYKNLNPEFLSHRCVLGIEVEDEKEVGGGYKVGNAFMASEPGMKLWYDFVESIFLRNRKMKDPTQQPTDNHEKEMQVLFLSGPHALSLFLKEHKHYEQEVTIMPAAMIYPMLCWKGLSAIKDKTTIGVHLCWGRWRNVPISESIKQRVRRLGSSVI